MAHLTRLALALLLVALLVHTIRADDPKFDTPENAAKAWADALVKGDGKAALACLIKSEREDKDIQKEFAEQPESEKATKFSYKLGESKIDGDNATVKATLTYTTGNTSGSMNMVFVCAKEDGEWRVCYRKTQEQTKASNPDILREARESEARATLGALKDRCRVVNARAGKPPAKLAETDVGAEEFAMKYWTLLEEFRVASDGKNMIIEAWSKDSDSMLMVRQNLEDGTASFLGCQRKIDNEASQKDAQTLLTTMRDYLRVQYAKLGAMPKNITGDGKTVTTYDLVGEYWIVHNEFTSKDNTVSLTADSINEAKIARLEFDITKGGGDVKYADAYSKEEVQNREKALKDMGEIIKALNVYKLDTSEYPDSLDAVKDQFKDNKIPGDPFSGKPYTCEFPVKNGQKGIKITCLGRDNKPGGRWCVDKDIAWTERGQAD